MFIEEITKEEFGAEVVLSRKFQEADPIFWVENRRLAKKIKKLTYKDTSKSREKIEQIVSKLYSDVFGFHSEMERIFYRSDLEAKEHLKDISKKVPDAIFVHVRVSAEDDEDEDTGEAWIVALMPDPMAAYEFRKQYADYSLPGLH